MASDLRDVSKRRPCPACGKPDGCAVGRDDGRVVCRRPDAAAVPDGMVETTRRGTRGFRTFKPDDGRGRTPRAKPARPVARPATADGDAPADGPPAWLAPLAARVAGQLDARRRDALAAELGLPASCVGLLPGVGWATAGDLRVAHAGGFGGKRPGGAWAFPEVAGDGRTVVGTSFRAPGAAKGGAGGGCSRGLTVPATLDAAPADAPVLVVEGASDVLALASVGVAAVGRPSNAGGADLLADLLRGRAARVTVVGENDRKDGGAWPGRDGAEAVAARLAEAWGRPVRWAMPPADAKDARAWVLANAPAGDDDDDARRSAGRELARLLDAGSRRAEPPADDGRRRQCPATADALAELLAAHFRIGRRDDDGSPFAAWRDPSRPNLAMPFRGGPGSLGAALRKLHRDATGRVPPGQAVADVLAAAEGDAAEAAAEPVGLRVAALPGGGGVAVDLGTPDGRAAVVTAGGWEVAARSPVPFRRTPLVGEMPMPTRGGPGLTSLLDLLNLDDDDRPPLVGWMVAAVLPDAPCPALLLTGGQGTGKSSAARAVRGVVDPSPAPVAGEPRDAEAWAMHAHNARVVVADNVSGVPPWWADALCRTVTGDAVIRRQLYTDAGAAVLRVRRPVILTSIDAGPMPPDLRSRLLTCELPGVDPARREAEADRDRRYAAALPSMLCDLLDATAAVLKALAGAVRPAPPPPGVDPRMADFCRVLAALDVARPDLTGRGRAVELYYRQLARAAVDAVEGDPFALAVRELAGSAGEWSGTAGDLLDVLNARRRGGGGGRNATRGWPADATRCAGLLRRAAPALAAAGVIVDVPACRTNAGRVYTIRDADAGGTRADAPCAAASPASPASPPAGTGRKPPAAGRNGRSAGDAGTTPQRRRSITARAASVTPAPPASPQRHRENGRHAAGTAPRDAGDAGDAAARGAHGRGGGVPDLPPPDNADPAAWAEAAADYAVRWPKNVKALTPELLRAEVRRHLAAAGGNRAGRGAEPPACDPPDTPP